MMIPHSGFLWELKYILHVDHLAQGLVLKEINIFVIILFTLLNMQAILIWMLMFFFCWALFLFFYFPPSSIFFIFFSSQWPEVRLLRFFNHLNFSLILKIFLFYVRGDFILILILQMIAFHKHLGISEYCFLYSRNFLLYLVYGWWASLFSRDFVNLF